MPPPDAVAAYQQIDPSFPGRLMAMAERQEAHRQDLERFVIHRDSRRADWGTGVGGLIAVVGYISSAVVILNGHDWAGVAGILAITGELVGTFIYGTRSRREERKRKNEEQAVPGGQ